MKKVLSWQSENDIMLLAKSLESNEVSITSTDTIYGFLANISQTAYDRLKEIKGREESKSFIILTSKKNIDQFINREKLDAKIKKIIDNLWPGPLTTIFKAREGLPSFMKSQEETVALREPNHEGLLKLLTKLKGLFSTSANKAGKPAPKHIEEIDKELLQKTTLLFNTLPQKNIPSTILDCSQENKVIVIREGAIKKSEIERHYGSEIFYETRKHI